ncbi:MAG: leucine-rich repeat domain-containing protein [Clostridia bacterium]|nr:leucine-rich repeat domain-containing protein [Clostridia bacterium]
MKKTVKIKKWQLLRCRADAPEADLSEVEFVTVGRRAFVGSRAESVMLPPQLSAVKGEAFLGCRRLCRVVLPAGRSVGISSRAFGGCVRLQAVDGMELVSAIGDGAFAGCALLREAPLGNGLRRIGNAAFAGCRSLRAISLPFSLESLGEGAFRDCSELAKVSLPANLCAGGKELFRGCLSLREIELPSAWREIPDGAFRDCTALECLALPEGLETVGKRAFMGCSRLREVSIPLGVRRIGAFAFADVPLLREIFIPHSVKHLGLGAFGLGKREPKDRILLTVENEYMVRKLRRMLFFCGSLGCVTVSVIGKSIEERKRARRRASLDTDPVHLVDFEE